MIWVTLERASFNELLLPSIYNLSLFSNGLKCKLWWKNKIGVNGNVKFSPFCVQGPGAQRMVSTNQLVKEYLNLYFSVVVNTGLRKPGFEQLGPGSRFTEVPKRFRARKARFQTATRLLGKLVF